MRLRTLPVSVAGVLAAVACCMPYDNIRVLPLCICMLFAVLAQIVANFANEYFDFKGQRDRKGRDGFRRGVTEGDISPAAMKRATYILLAVDCLLGLALTIWGGLWLVIPGILIALFAIAYSGGPYPLSCHGLGDVAVVIFFGLVPVYFTTYLGTGEIDTWHTTMPVGLAVGLLAANVLIVNNYRDMDDDKLVNKRTTVVMFGRKFMSWIYLINILVSLALVTWATLQFLYVGPVTKLPRWGMVWALMIWAGFSNWRDLKRLQGAELNVVLKKTSQYLLCVIVVFLVWQILAYKTTLFY